MRMPPSTFMAWPVMFRASSEARKAASLPMSSGVCSRFIGVMFSTARSNSARPDMSSPVTVERLREMACHISVQSRPGTYRVDGYAVWGELMSAGLGPAYDRSFSRGVVRDVGAALPRGYGGYVDDAPRSALYHLTLHCLGDHYDAAHVDHVSKLPVFVAGFVSVPPFARANDARIVDQDVYAAHFAEYL